jgi:predicted transcriptional regulator
MTTKYIITSVRFDNDEYLMLQNLAALMSTSNSEVMRAALRYYYNYIKSQKQINH